MPVPMSNLPQVFLFSETRTCLILTSVLLWTLKEYSWSAAATGCAWNARTAAARKAARLRWVMNFMGCWFGCFVLKAFRRRERVRFGQETRAVLSGRGASALFDAHRFRGWA